LVIQAFDPLSGPGKELVRIPLDPGTSADIGLDYWWQLSPDGSRIGIVKRHGDHIRLIPVGGGPTRTITTKGYSDFLDLNWAIDSKSMFVSAAEPGAVTLLHVDLAGDAHSVWRQSQAAFTWGIQSPDGLRLAILGSNFDSNVWMIDNF